MIALQFSTLPDIDYVIVRNCTETRLLCVILQKNYNNDPSLHAKTFEAVTLPPEWNRFVLTPVDLQHTVKQGHMSSIQCRPGGQVILVSQVLTPVPFSASSPVYLRPISLGSTRPMIQMTDHLMEHKMASGIRRGVNSHWCLCVLFTSRRQPLSRFSLPFFPERYDKFIMGRELK